MFWGEVPGWKGNDQMLIGLTLIGKIRVHGLRSLRIGLGHGVERVVIIVRVLGANSATYSKETFQDDRTSIVALAGLEVVAEVGQPQLVLYFALDDLAVVVNALIKKILLPIKVILVHA